MTVSTFSPGTMIANLRLVRLLGIGGFGEVWLAEHLDLGDEVAVKIPLVPEYVRVLRLEGRLQHQLDHENIVHVIDLNTTHDPPYCVMEFVEGENLRQRIDREGKLPLAEVRRIARSVLFGLREAHRLGIVHRDLKPENVLIAKDGTVKIVDFGLGSVVNEVTRSVVRSSQASGAASGTEAESADSSSPPDAESVARSDNLGPAALSVVRIVGTYDYMSPEQRQGEDVDARSDVYSLGVMMVEMLTAQRPYGDVSARLRRHEIPEEMSKAILCALDDKEYRHADAEAFMHALRIHLPEKPVLAGGTFAAQIEAFMSQLEDRLAYLEGGVFTMGSDDGPENERPAHPRQVEPFCLARYAVTASEFCFFLNDIGGNKARLFRPGRSSTVQLVGNIYRPAPGCENHPANCVSHSGALMFCDWLNKRLGSAYRLPSEVEWEYAADSIDIASGTACFGRQMTTPEETLCPVDAFAPNRFGLYQMVGNVAEWCQESYLGSYCHTHLHDETDHGSSARLYVARGGFWSNPADDLMPTRRRVYIGQTFSPGIGFRLARSAGGTS